MRGTRKKIANTTALTTKSRITAPIRRRIMYVSTLVGLVGGGHARCCVTTTDRCLHLPLLWLVRAEPLLFGRAHGRVVVHSERVVDEDVRQVIRTCLLYTSDAADEE